MLFGGELVLDRSPGSSANLTQRRTRDNGAQLVLAGGDLTFHGSANGSVATEMLNSNLVIMAGDSVLRVRPAGATQSNLLHVANFAGSTVTRQTGGTVHVIYGTTLGGGAGLLFGQTPNIRLGSWAVFSSNTTFESLTWARTQSGSVHIEPFTGYSIDAYGKIGYHTDVRNGSPTLWPADVVGSLRFDTNLFMNLNLRGNQLNVADGGILVTRGSEDGLGGPQGIANGFLGSQSGEVILHNYSPYGFNISAAITGPVSFTHSGVSTTTLSGANPFAGRVFLNGGVLVVDDPARLGQSTNQFELRGGVLRLTQTMSFSNNIVVGGDGGQIWVDAGRTVTNFGRIDSETNLFGAVLPNLGHGDYIKSGPGTQVGASLTIGTPSVSNWIQGAIDIRGGVLKVDRFNLTNEVFGTSRSFFDGTIVRSGASLIINIPTNGLGENSSADIREWLTLEHGAMLAVLNPDDNFQSRRWNAPIRFLGDATVFVEAEDFNLNTDAGYILGPGSIVKEGDGALLIRQFSPEFTGEIRVQDGVVDMVTSGPFPTPNASNIVIGIAANTNRGLVAFRVRPEQDSLAKTTIVPQNIRVLGESDATRLSVFRSDHNDSIRFTGNIDLTGFDNFGNHREFQLHRSDDSLTHRGGDGGDTFDERTFIWLEGSITGINKRIRTLIEQGGSPNTQDKGAQAPPELDLHVLWTLGGNNSGWTGTLELGNRQGTSAGAQGPDFDKEHFVRFGNNDGLPTAAISSNVVVVLRHDAHLQAFGSQVTIGTLFTDGKADNVTSDYFGSDLTTNSFIENAGTQPGSFRICQFTNATVSATIRDGTYWSPTEADAPAAALSILKDGPATLTLLASNSFSGLARVMSGTLALSGTGSIRNAHTIQIDAGATLNVNPRVDQTLRLAAGQTLQGNGTLTGGLIAESGSFVKPGTSPGALTVVGDVTFQSGATYVAEVLGTLAGQYDQLLMGPLYELELNGATLSVLAPTPLTLGAVIPIISGWGTIDASTFGGLPDNTTFAAGANLFQINYGTLSGYEDDVTLTVVPEPGTLGLVGLALLAAGLPRRRRRC